MVKEEEIILMARYIRAAKVDPSDFEEVVLNEELVEMIRTSKIASLKELIGEDPKAALHRLAKDYWGTK